MNINITKAYYSTLIQGNHINRMPANIKNFEKTTPKEQNIWDICYKHPYPLNILCNFSPSFFKLNGIVINSMEGFLQSLKMKDAELQKKICQLPGILAKKLGNYLRKSTMYDGRSLHWQNQDFDRYSPIYHNLLKAAYAAKYDYDKSFRQIIKESRGRTLTHTIGKSSESETVLTEKEFIENLCILRNSKFNIGRFFIRKNRNALTISQNLPELKTSFVNSSIICGENVFTKGDALLKKLKKLGISNIIDIEQTTRSKNNAKLAKKNQLQYLNLNLSNKDYKKFANKTLIDLINIINKNNVSYICCNKREDSSLVLILNYLFNPKATIADSPVFGGLKKKNIQKLTNLVKTHVTPETRKQLGWEKDFDSVLELRKKILHELNN